MPAKQKIAKRRAELSESEQESQSDSEETIRITRSKKKKDSLSGSSKKASKSKAQASKPEKKARNFITLSEEAKISANCAKLLTYIVGGKHPVGRNEITSRAKTFLRGNEEFKNLKLTVTALNSITLVMNHRFGALFNIASILATLRGVQTINALDLDIANAILDGSLGSINNDSNKYMKVISEYRKKDIPIQNVDLQFADKILSAAETVTAEDELTLTQIREIFRDPTTIAKINKELKNYKRPISSTK